MTCEETRALLTALNDEELPDDTARIVKAHLAGCADCAQLRRELSATTRLAENWAVPEGEVWPTVHVEIAASMDRHRVPTGTRGPGERWEDPDGWVQLLIARNLVTENDIARAKAESTSLPFIDLKRHRPEVSAIAMLPAEIARRLRALPCKKDGQQLWVAMANPLDTAALEEIRRVSRCPVVRPMLAMKSDLETAIAAAYSPEVTAPEPAAEPELLGELREMRAEMKALKAEMVAMRREMAGRPSEMPRPFSTSLLPYAPPEETWRPLV